ncbi:MAG: magnesium transporter [Candidatus Bathyarchaeota archaeon]|nr:magnesium transporter [Candidatus Bathyarchaeota archaeon]
MTQTGGLTFSKALRETFVAYAFDLVGLAAGFLVAYELGVFKIAPWAIALYPAVLGSKGVIEGILSGRLSTALHLGTVYPRFSKNTKSFYNLIESVVVLTLITSVAMSAISLVFGTLFWGITFADFPAILSVVVATMALGLALLAVTVKVAFVSFTKGLDPDIMVYPIMSAVASIFITLCYIVTLNLFLLNNAIGVWTVALLGGTHLLLAIYIFPKNLHEQEFIKTIRESLAALMIVALIVNVTGTLLRGISRYANSRIEFYTVYPALIGLVSDVGAVVGSTATTKLALGMIKPKLSSIKHHAVTILTAWLASIVMFIALAFVALFIHGIFTPTAFYNSLTVLLLTNVIAVTLIVVLSFAISIVSFQKSLDPGNFVIPIESAFAASITSVALLLALALLSFMSVI